MENQELQAKKVHHGSNIRRIRRDMGMTQDQLANKACLSQQTLSRYEAAQTIDEEMLQRFAKALNVPVELIKTMEGEEQSVVIENNQVTTNDHGVANGVGYLNYPTNTNNFNPINKIIELYERMIKDQNDKFAALEKRINELEQKNK